MGDIKELSKTFYQLVKEERMTEEPEDKTCDPDDIICQADRLAKMKNLRSVFGDEAFREKYPSLVELSDKLDENIKDDEDDLRHRLDVCNLPVEILERKEPEEKEE